SWYSGQPYARQCHTTDRYARCIGSHTPGLQRGTPVPQAALMKSKQRVVWTEQEREAVAAAGRDLRSKHPRLTIDQLLGKAQLVLPKSRRRPINANLNAWLSKELKTGAVKPARARRHIPAQVATTSAQRSKASSVSRA